MKSVSLITFMLVIKFLGGIFVTSFWEKNEMLKGWVRFIASKEPRNQPNLTVLIDLEGDIYERFTKCNVLEQQICLHR